MKLVRSQALPLSGDAGISDIRKMVLEQRIPRAVTRGKRTESHLLDDYLDHILSFIDTSFIKPFDLVLDAGSGMAGLVAPKLFERLPCQITPLCFEIDGNFPNHQANPLLEENRRHVVDRVIENQSDGAIAWDGDADRCFFIDGQGNFIAGDFITALLAEAFLRKEAGAKIVYDVRASHAVKDVVTKCGGTALMNRVGHAFFKTRMRAEGATFGGEVTGHYYFRDNFFADNGFIPALLILELMSVKNQTLSELLKPFRENYFISGEINTQMPTMNVANKKIEALGKRYSDGYLYRMDGISVEYPTWHFNVRASNTEPLLRLNLEGDTPELMEEKRDEILELVRR
jgi:phosphomannomutase